MHQLRAHLEILGGLVDEPRTSRDRASLPASGLGDTTMRRTRRPVRASARTTETTCGTSAGALEVSVAVFSPHRHAAPSAPRTAVLRIFSEQKRILLFYPIITGFLQSASTCLPESLQDASATILSWLPPDLCWLGDEAAAWAGTKRCCPIADRVLVEHVAGIVREALGRRGSTSRFSAIRIATGISATPSIPTRSPIAARWAASSPRST